MDGGRGARRHFGGRLRYISKPFLPNNGQITVRNRVLGQKQQKEKHDSRILLRTVVLFRSAPSGTRTQDPLIKSQLLSQVASTKSGVLILMALRNPLCIRIFILLFHSDLSIPSL